MFGSNIEQLEAIIIWSGITKRIFIILIIACLFGRKGDGVKDGESVISWFTLPTLSLVEVGPDRSLEQGTQ